MSPLPHTTAGAARPSLAPKTIGARTKSSLPPPPPPPFPPPPPSALPLRLSPSTSGPPPWNSSHTPASLVTQEGHLAHEHGLLAITKATLPISDDSGTSTRPAAAPLATFSARSRASSSALRASLWAGPPASRRRLHAASAHATRRLALCVVSKLESLATSVGLMPSARSLVFFFAYFGTGGGEGGCVRVKQKRAGVWVLSRQEADSTERTLCISGGDTGGAATVAAARTRYTWRYPERPHVGTRKAIYPSTLPGANFSLPGLSSFMRRLMSLRVYRGERRMPRCAAGHASYAWQACQRSFTAAMAAATVRARFDVDNMRADAAEHRLSPKRVTQTHDSV